MIVETKLDFKRYLNFMYTLTFRRPITIFMVVSGLIMFIVSLLYFLGFKGAFKEPPIFQITFGFVITVVLPFSVYRSAKKNFSSHGRIQEKIIYEFTDEKIKLTGETFNSELDWGKTYKVIELKEWILIYQNRQTANIIPKESFGVNLKEFKALVNSKNIKSKWR